MESSNERRRSRSRKKRTRQQVLPRGRRDYLKHYSDIYSMQWSQTIGSNCIYLHFLFNVFLVTIISYVLVILPIFILFITERMNGRMDGWWNFWFLFCFVFHPKPTCNISDIIFLLSFVITCIFFKFLVLFVFFKSLLCDDGMPLSPFFEQ